MIYTDVDKQGGGIVEFAGKAGQVITKRVNLEHSCPIFPNSFDRFFF